MKYYLRIEDSIFLFVIEGVHDIKDTDKVITLEDYNSFFELQTKGKQFRIKENTEGNGLFDILEEYIPVNEDIGIQAPTEKERLEAIELLLLEVL